MSADAELFEALQAALPPPTPVYDPKVEITILDLAKRNNWSKSKAGNWLLANGWETREVMVDKRKATAYRPKGT